MCIVRTLINTNVGLFILGIKFDDTALIRQVSKQIIIMLILKWITFDSILLPKLVIENIVLDKIIANFYLKFIIGLLLIFFGKQINIVKIIYIFSR